MLELTTDNLAEYLRVTHRVEVGVLRVELLGGGVSNAVFRVEGPGQLFVLKQSRPQLRTRDAWFSDLDRVYREQEIMEALHPLLPDETVPRILFVDRPNYVFAMSHAPTPCRVWKESLLAGEIDQTVATRSGTVLGRMHQASAETPLFRERFVDQTVFIQLRTDPFYRTVQNRCADIAAFVGPIIEQLANVKEAICHGDYTPKNILTHAKGFTLVDYETAHFGDPTMDMGLFLCHLVLKAARSYPDHAAVVELTRQFWQGYAKEVRFQPVDNLEARTVPHLAICLRARIDGTSPIDYLPDERKRAGIRNLTRRLLHEQISTWSDVINLFEVEFA